MKTLLSIAVVVTIQFSTAAPLQAQSTSAGDNLDVAPDLNIRSRTEEPAVPGGSTDTARPASRSTTPNWRENILAGVPKDVCAENTWHRQCFNIRESQCISATTEVVGDCLEYVQNQQKKNATPTTTSMSMDELQEQTRLCVITLYERRYARRFKFIQTCTDRTQW